MCFLFRYAKSREQVNNSLGFDLEFTGELIDTYLGCVIHASLGIFLFLLLHRFACFRRLNGGRGFLCQGLFMIWF